MFTNLDFRELSGDDFRNTMTPISNSMRWYAVMDFDSNNLIRQEHYSTVESWDTTSGASNSISTTHCILISIFKYHSLTAVDLGQGSGKLNYCDIHSVCSYDQFNFPTCSPCPVGYAGDPFYVCVGMYYIVITPNVK